MVERCIKSGQVQSEQVKSGQVKSGQVKLGQVKSGQVKSGQVTAGQINSGQVNSGPTELCNNLHETVDETYLPKIDEFLKHKVSGRDEVGEGGKISKLKEGWKL